VAQAPSTFDGPIFKDNFDTRRINELQEAVATLTERVEFLELCLAKVSAAVSSLGVIIK